MSVQSPAPSPCAAYPYRRDVPSGVWSVTEYAKLTAYDRPTGEQPSAVFQCHVFDRDDGRARVCGGWAGCHGGAHLLALRIARISGVMSPEDVEATVAYESLVPLFDSGREAAVHGMREIHNPGPEARKAMRKIERIRTDLAEDRPAEES